MKTIGWIGLGNMGRPMVSNLLKAGFEVHVYNRDQNKAKDVLEKGAKFAQSPKEIAETCDVIVTMVSDASAVEAVFTGDSGLLKGLSAGKTVIDMSTIGPDDSRRFAAWVNEKEAQFLDAPVSGSVKPAAEGTLVILIGGDVTTYQECLPIFDVLGKTSIHFGGQGTGSNAKLVINLLLGLTMQGVSEALILAEKLGLDREQVLQMITDSACNTPILQMKKQNFLTEEFPAAFALKLMTKDFGLALDAARKVAAPLPTTAAAHSIFTTAKATGKGDLDISAIFLQLKEMAGAVNQENAKQPVGTK